MTMHKAARIVPAALFAAVIGAAPVQAAAASDATDATPTVRVVNNHDQNVAVYVVSADGQRHYLGTVNRSQFRAFQVPTEALTGETVQVQVIPRTGPAGLGVRTSEEGVQTAHVAASADRSIQLWLEPELARSTATVGVS